MEMMSKNNLKRSHQVAIVMVPIRGHSPVIQLLHLSNLIATSFDIPIHFIQPNITLKHHPNYDRVNINSKIHIHGFQIPPNPPSFPFYLSLLPTMSHLQEPVLELTQQLSPQFKSIIIIHDPLMSSLVQHVIKSIPNGEAYALQSFSAFVSFFAWWESLPQKPFDLECSSLGNIPLEEPLPPGLADFLADQYRLNSGFTSGKILNTSRVIEGRFIDLLGKIPFEIPSPSTQKIKQFVLGPFNPMKITYWEESVLKHRCLQWLDQQEPNSVIFISFGTKSSISKEQVKEVAIGLERSGQKFMWVLGDAHKDHVDDDDDDGPLLGFEERVGNQGLVVRDWAPQLEILADGSTGGFMTHCGWGSCMESISMGVPMAAWPLRADQPKNSVLMTQVLKVGILVREWAKRGKIVSSDMVENVVRKLMASVEGNELRIRAKELGLRVRESCIDKDGDSRLEMESFIAHITR